MIAILETPWLFMWLLDVKPFITTWWLTAGYHLLSVLFIAFTALFTWAALG